MGRVREKTGRRKKIREEKGRRKKIPVEKSQNTVFPMFWSSGGSAGAEPSGEMRDAKLHAAVKMHKTPHCQRTFGSSDLQKVHPFVAEAHVEVKMSKARRVWTGALLEVQKIVKKCTSLWREAHFAVKMIKAHHFGALLEVEMLKKRTLLWGEAHLKLKMPKTLHARTTFGS